MISEGSHDTEDWSKDYENSALHHRNNTYFQIENRYIKFHNITAFTVFVDYINSVLVVHRDFF